MITDKQKAEQAWLDDLPRQCVMRQFKLAASLNPTEWAPIIAAGNAPWQVKETDAAR